MTDKPLDWIADAARAGSELKAQIREAHEAIRDLKTAKKEVADALAEAQTTLHEEITLILERAVVEAIDELGEKTRAAMDAAVDKVNNEFQILEDLLLGKHKEGPSFDHVAFAYQLLQLLKDDRDRIRLIDVKTGKQVNPDV